MQHKPYSYLFYIQYLGLRYSGWQKQKNAKTVQGTIERGIRYVLGHEDFTLLGASRTDSGVSCEKGAFQLFLRNPLHQDGFLEKVNINLPSDIRLISFQQVPKTFNIIQDISWKEYHYYMAFGQKSHPFAAGNLTYFPEIPSMSLMQEGAKVFVGNHDFRRFCAMDKITENYRREIYHTEISPHPMAGTCYIPANALFLKVRGNGFLRYQIRMMVSVLIELGAGRLSSSDIMVALQSQESTPLTTHAAPNGLVLFDLKFNRL